MTGTPPKACLIGHPVAHSRSPKLHGYWLKTLGIAGAYELADVTAENFPEFLRNLRARGYVGANITVPHKEIAFHAVTRRDKAASAIGAVNVVWHENGELVAGNTDVHGFLAHLDATAPGWHDVTHRAVVLGAGGGARSITYGLRSRGVNVDLVNRTVARAETLAAEFGASAHGWGELSRLLGSADLLVNATAMGMIGKPALDIDLAPLPHHAIVYDIVYVPLETALLRAARGRGHYTVDGLGMLLHQAVPAFARWFGVTPRVTPELRAMIEADIKASV
jgi:shikimate dehydrogenase